MSRAIAWKQAVLPFFARLGGRNDAVCTALGDNGLLLSFALALFSCTHHVDFVPQDDERAKNSRSVQRLTTMAPAWSLICDVQMIRELFD